jgi:hypothetical protein
MFGRKAREIARLRREVDAWRNVQVHAHVTKHERGQMIRTTLVSTDMLRLSMGARYGSMSDVARLFSIGDGGGVLLGMGHALEVEIGPLPQPWMASDEPR